MHTLRNFVDDQSGATAIEYGLLAVGVAITIITVVRGVGTNLNTAFTKVNTGLR